MSIGGIRGLSRALFQANRVKLPVSKFPSIFRPCRISGSSRFLNTRQIVPIKREKPQFNRKFSATTKNEIESDIYLLVEYLKITKRPLLFYENQILECHITWLETLLQKIRTGISQSPTLLCFTDNFENPITLKIHLNSKEDVQYYSYLLFAQNKKGPCGIILYPPCS